MQAIVQDNYGSGEALALREIERPEIGEHDVLVRVRAAGVNPADWAVMSGLPYIARPVYGLRRPKVAVRGTDVAGYVAAVGSAVTRFKPGDEVFGASTGSYAEYAAASEDELALKPAQPDLRTGRHGSDGRPRGPPGHSRPRQGPSGQTVLINGASGGIGTFAIQIAKALGAEVTAVASTRNLELVRSVGADHVIDYTSGGLHQPREALRRHPRQRLEPPAVPTPTGSDRHRRAHPERRELRKPMVLERGPAHPGTAHVPVRHPESRAFLVSTNHDDLVALKELIEAGKVTPVLDRTYPLSDAAQAIDHVGRGHAQGKVAITV